MEPVLWALGGLAGAVVLAGFAEAWYKRDRKYPLSASRPTDIALHDGDDVPLGQEATDLKAFNKVVTLNDRLTAQTSTGGRAFAGRTYRTGPHDTPAQGDEDDRDR